MTKRTKRFIAGLLTASMVLGSLTMVYAGVEGEQKTLNGKGGFDVKGESTVNEAEIHVIVPTEFDYVVNPFGMPLEVEVGHTDLSKFEDKKTVSGQIIAPVYTIENKSEVPLKLYVKSVSANGDGIAIKTSSAKKAKEKSAYLFLQLGKTDDVKALFQENRYSKMINWEKTNEKKTTYKNDEAYKSAMKAGNIVEVKVGTKDKPTTMKKPINVNANEKVYLTVNGDVNANPTDKPWKESDQVTLGYTLYFEAAGGAAAN